MSVTPSFSELKAILKPMSWKDRVEYLWTYYKVVLVAVVVVLAIISLVVSAIQSKQIQTLYSGALINLSVEREDQDELVNELTALLDGDGKNRVVKLTDIAYIPGNDPDNYEVNDAGAMKLAMLVTTGSLDFILTDDDTYGELIEREPYANLQNILTQEQQTQLKDNMIWRKADGENPSYPMALDISSTAFAKAVAPYEKVVYLVFVGNTENGERNQAFLDYILNSKN